MGSEDSNNKGHRDYVHSMLRRCRAFDYRKPWIYMVTLMKSDDVDALSLICGANEDSARVELLPNGCLFNECLEEFLRRSPAIRRITSVVMPDHVHVLFRVIETLPRAFGSYVQYLKSICTSEYRKRMAAVSAEAPSFFKMKFNDVICFEAGQRQAMYNYIQDNPRRRWVVMHNHDFFSRMNRLMFEGKTITAYGNQFLLDCPDMATVRWSHHFTPSEFERLKDYWRTVAARGGVLVSPFINVKEREVLREATALGGRIIYIKSNGFADRFKPGGKLFELCSEGRLLIVAPAEWRPEWDLEKARDSDKRRICMNMNVMAEKLADYLLARPR